MNDHTSPLLLFPIVPDQSFPSSVKVQSEESTTPLSTMVTESTTDHFNGRLNLLMFRHLLITGYSPSRQLSGLKCPRAKGN